MPDTTVNEWMITAMSNSILLNSFFIGAITQERGSLATSLDFGLYTVYNTSNIIFFQSFIIHQSIINIHVHIF